MTPTRPAVPSPPPPLSAAAPSAAGARWRERGIRLGLCAVMSLWVLAFTPDPHVVGTWPGLVAGLALVERPKRFRETAFWVALFGAFAIGFGYRWLAGTARDFGELDARLGVFAAPASWLILAAYGVAGTIHGILFAALHRATIRPDRRPHPLLTVTLFVACETLPVRFLPWLAGYGAVDVAPLRMLAAFGGVPLVSFALLCLVIPFHEFLRWKFAKTGPPARPRAALVTLALGAALTGLGGFVSLGEAVMSEVGGTPHVKVAILQGNVGAHVKREGERDGGDGLRTSREVYRRLTRKAAADGADLIVLPETAIGTGLPLWDTRTGRPRPPGVISEALRREGLGFIDEVGKDSTILIGCYVDEEAPGPATGPPRETVRYNAAVLREPGGVGWSIYRKTRLIPFGEAMPGESMFPGLGKWLPQGFRMTPGPQPQPPLRWEAKHLLLATFICYEDILADDVRAICGDERPDLLVNLTNDSWFGDTWEPWQHLNFSRFRAVEHGVPLVRATNTGVSAFVSPNGEAVEKIPVGVEGLIVQSVGVGKRPRTLFAATGAYQRWAWWIVAVLGFAWTRFRRRP